MRHLLNFAILKIKILYNDLNNIKMSLLIIKTKLVSLKEFCNFKTNLIQS